MSDYLAHYGRKGMKWGKHIFGDKDNSKNDYVLPTSPASPSSVPDDDLTGRRRRMSANQAAAKSITKVKRKREAIARRADFQLNAATKHGYSPLVTAGINAARKKNQKNVTDRNVYAAVHNKGYVALAKAWTRSVDDVLNNATDERAIGRYMLRSMGLAKTFKVAEDAYSNK